MVERVHSVLDGHAIGAVHYRLQFRKRLVDPLAFTWLELLGRDQFEIRTPQYFLRRVHHALGFVARVDEEPRLEIGLRMLERFDQHALHFLVGQSVRWLHFDGLLDTRAQLAGADAENAVRVDLEPHFDAREARGHWRDA